MDWKKVVDTTWNPTTQNADSAMVNAREVWAMRVASVVNALAIRWGNVCPNA